MTTTISRTASLVSVCVLIGVASCVELTGQRITIRYDDTRDVLQLLLCHDGIHDSGSPQHRKGVEQIPEHVRNGDILLLDWVGHIRRNDLREAAVNQGLPVEVRDFARRVDSSLEPVAVGHYRDLEGRIGAAQLVTITGAREIIRSANIALRAAVLVPGDSTEWPGTLERWRAAAREGRDFLALEGHSLRFTFPAHPDEWSRHKAALIKNLVEEWQKARESQSQGNRSSSPALILQLLAISPLTLEESRDSVSIRFGERSRPSTFRFTLRDAYEPSLEGLVRENVPTDLDRELSARLLEERPVSATDPVDSILGWGPPEDAVRALVAAARSGDEKARGRAIERLRARGDAWKRDGRLPAAPAWEADAARYLDGWGRWYGEVLRHPVGGD